MDLEDVNEIKVEKIYWEWPFETGESEAEILANDLIDAEFLGKTISMEIAVTGTEVLEGPSYLADVIEIGDYINYNATAYDGNGNLYSYTPAPEDVGVSSVPTYTSNDTFSTTAPAQWRVYSINRQTGVIELIPANSTTQKITFYGGNAFLKAEDVLNSAASVYGHGIGATGARSINMADVEKYSSYDKTTYENKNSNTGYYGGTIDYTTGKFYRQIKDKNGNITGYDSTVITATETSPITMAQSVYKNNYFSNYFNNNAVYQMIFKDGDTSSFKNTYLLASRGVNLSADTSCTYDIQVIYNNTLQSYYMYFSTGGGNSAVGAICPIVTLQANIQTTGQDENGVWQLKID